MGQINCILVEGGGITSFEADALYFFGQQMIKKKDERFIATCAGLDTEIVITTKMNFTFFSGISGIAMNAEINRGSKTIKVEFLVRPTKQLKLPVPGAWQVSTREEIAKRATAAAALN